MIYISQFYDLGSRKSFYALGSQLWNYNSDQLELGTTFNKHTSIIHFFSKAFYAYGIFLEYHLSDFIEII